MIGRPQNSEAAPYYFTYIDLVSGDDPVRVIAQQLDETSAFCASIPEERSLYRYTEDKWSIRQILSHINDTERTFAFRALWFSRGFEAPLPSLDQNVAAAGAQADRLPWAAHVEEFRGVRLASLALFRNMPAEGWKRGGVASDNYVTVRALAYMIAGHLMHHLLVIRERYR